MWFFKKRQIKIEEIKEEIKKELPLKIGGWYSWGLDNPNMALKIIRINDIKLSQEKFLKEIKNNWFVTYWEFPTKKYLERIIYQSQESKLKRESKLIKTGIISSFSVFDYDSVEKNFKELNSKKSIVYEKSYQKLLSKKIDPVKEEIKEIDKFIKENNLV